MDISSEELCQTYQQSYDDLYNDKYPKPVQDCLRDMGDILIERRKDIVKIINEDREDMMISDREVAAFALALYTIGAKYRVEF